MKNKKPKQPSIKLVQKKVWEECKRIIKNKYPNTCYTCGAKDLVGSNWQTGHMVAKAFLKPYLKYDLRLLRPQCMRCNLRLGGLGAIFITKMMSEKGRHYVDDILEDMDTVIEKKGVYDFYEHLIEEYKKL